MDVDFRIEVGPGGADGYPVTFRTTDGEEAADVLRLPPPRELEALAERVPDAVVASSARVRRAAVGSEAPVRELGRMLFDALLGGAGAALLLAARNRAAQRGGQVRMVLRVQPPELARLPWEFLYDTAEDTYVCLEVPLVRHPQVARPVEPLVVTPPLRILGMVARPEDQEPLAVRAEQQRLRDALSDLLAEGRVELGWVGGQTWRDLRNAVRRDARSAVRGATSSAGSRTEWHILHFIGHGGYDSVAQEGTLALAGEHGETYPLGAGQLAMLLAGHPSLRLAVLNACETGRADGLNPFSSVAGALMRKGLPAVLAMQYEVSEDAALECAHAFYDSLARQLPIDVAVMEARQAMTLARPGTLEWGTPVLYLRSLDGGGHLFDFAGTADPAPPEPRPVPGPAGAEPKEGEEISLEELYAEGLAALYTDRWREAVEAFRAVLARDSDYRDCRAKLAQARHGQRLASLYAAATAAAAARDWDQAVDHLEAIAAVEPGYGDSAALLEQARAERDRARLRAEIVTLHRSGRWQAVLAVAERLRHPAVPDPEVAAMADAAREALAAADRAQTLAARYREALDHMDGGQWREALGALRAVRALDAEYRDTGRLLAKVREEVRGTGVRPLAAAPLPVVTAPHTVFAVAFGPDGSRLALGTGRRVAMIADDQGNVLHTLRHGGIVAGVWGVDFSSDGTRLATGSGDLTARTWDVETGAEVSSHYTGHTVHAVSFSPDGHRLACCDLGGNIRMLDIGNGTELWRLSDQHQGSARSAVFDPLGGRVATVGNNDLARIWNAETGAELMNVTHPRSMLQVRFSPDGGRLATASDSHTARVWDAETGAQLLEVGHAGQVNAVSFSPDGALLATGSHDRTARVWNAHTGDQLLVINHGDRVRDVVFAPDGERLATASGKQVHLWRLEENDHD
ncbi:CHAT domain-containing protein [Streptomyces spinoverrucosus]|uniref:CHAT domain-containing protein n=1 Tax=Streptomyces spinoverrucosus TaxID=284043 RepID=UPI0018C3DD78|nr:CHAT domain-containing protein [Streptomyces spinoverrucosus]MBG0853006.1 CHAT domain-containing protein [Streptomyces spinoverrucosus]